ncbi:DNA topoisomerase IB [Georgenia subflava]|uniref:DNA topoisomerase n=1 Tax=Georgenia subflava TaxID=1622177 RepID=A0A6N7EN25_9MICO|nr:DNA topoisomerase IB [Georgenia subflava]MPV38851.1 DNA topoisomerase IB [Georgenia subflava]
MRLRRVGANEPGLTRRRSGRGFVYLDADGARVTDPTVVARCKALVIPPAWREVWICTAANGHIQAVGTDDAGRRQYLYHPAWRESRDAAKHERVLDLARRLPQARRQVTMDLSRPGMPRERAMAVAFRLLDRGFFRIGGESYAENNGSFGLATLRKDHVRIGRDGDITFDYLAKSGQSRVLTLRDEALVAPLTRLRRRRTGGQELLAFVRSGEWSDVTSADINEYVKDRLGPEASAKDFRTWHGTVLAALELAVRIPGATSRTARKRAERESVSAVAEYLGNTPAVCRASYIDSRVLDLAERGKTIDTTLARRADNPDEPVAPDTHGAVERAVLDLLG